MDKRVSEFYSNQEQQLFKYGQFFDIQEIRKCNDLGCYTQDIMNFKEILMTPDPDSDSLCNALHFLHLGEIRKRLIINMMDTKRSGL